jgi:fibronectin-binding autotransporter adhesin
MSKQKIKKFLLLVALLGLGGTIFSSPKVDAGTGTNQQLAFEGKIVLADGTNIANGTYNMEFKIYSGGTSTGGGTLQWTEDELTSASQGVTMTNGTFAINLGAVTPLSAVNWNSDTLWLSLQVGNTTSCTVTTTFQSNCGGDGEMTPYIRLTSVPYAFNAAELGGVAASGYGQLAGTQSWTATNTYSATAATAVALTGAPAANATNSLLQLGTAISGGSANGTYLGLNTASTTSADLVDLQNANAVKLKIDASGDLTAAGTIQGTAITAGTGLAVTSGGETITAGGLTVSAGGAAITGTTTINGTGSAATTIGNAASTTTIAGPLNLSGGETITGTENINTTGTANTTIGNSTGTLTLNSAKLNLSSAGLLTLFGGLAPDITTASGTSVNGLMIKPGTDSLATSTGAGLTLSGGDDSGTTAVTGGALTLLAGSGTGASGSRIGGSVTIDAGAGDSTTDSGTVGIGTTNANTLNLGNQNAGTAVNLSVPGSKILSSSNGVVIQNTTNNNLGFQVENAAGAPILAISTITGNNYLTYPGFESGSFTNASIGWAPVSPATISQNNTVANAYNGLYSLTLTTTASNGGAQTNAFIQTIGANTYNVSFYAKPSVAMNANGFTVTLNDGTAHACIPASQALNISGFIRVSCSTTTTANLTSLTIAQNDATARTIYIDAVQLQVGSTPTVYQVGGVQIRGAITNPVAIAPTSASTTAFQIANISGLNVLTVDTLDGLVEVGSNNVANTSQQLLQLNSDSTFAETSTCTTSVNQGALYYNSSSNAIRACVNGNWEDAVTTSGLGILAFGVIPDSGNAGVPGDVGGVSNYSNSPCKVVWTATQQVTVEPCNAYSGGRRVVVPVMAISTAAIAASTFVNICLTGTADQPALVGAGSSTETSAGVPTFSANNPVLCLATVKTSTTAGNVGNIWDTRTFTNVSKQFATVNSANANGYLVIGTTTAGVSQTTATAGTGPIRGTIIATTGTAATTSVNAIIATEGTVFVKFLSGGTATVDNYLETTTTAGYATSIAATATAGNYLYGGLLQATISTSCTTTNTVASACQYAPLVDFRPSR